MDEYNKIVTDLDIDAYHALENTISNTGLNLILDCPARYHEVYLAHDKKQKKDDMALCMGNALHTLVLEPTTFHQRFTISPPNLDRRTTEGKQAHAAMVAMDKPILSFGEYETITKMAKTVVAHKKFSKIISNGSIEHSLFWEWEGVRLKSRPDFYNDFVIVDLKTTKSVNPDSFCRAISDYGYHRQAALALDCLNALTGKHYKDFVILAVEKEPPYLTGMFRLDDAMIEIGRQEYRHAAKKYQRCLVNKEWPGYSENHEITDIFLPNWYKSPIN